MTRFQLATLLSLVCTTAACGGDDPDKGTVNTASARTSVDSVGGVSAAMTAMNGGGAATAVQAMTSAGQSIVTPASPMGRIVGLLPDHGGKPDVVSATGTAECTATMCTFTSYGDTGFTIDGTISRSGDTHTFDLTYDVTSVGTSLHWEIDGAVTVTATSIDGNTHSVGATNVDGGAGVAVNWDVAVDYNAVTVDSQGCPTAGSVHAATAYSISGTQGASFNVEGTVTFGPACGDAH